MIPPPEGWGWTVVAAGIALTAAGEVIRIWAVHHIGTISRTRSDRVGPLIDDGPFAVVRNPLYLGNIVLWIGFVVAAKLVWLAPLMTLLLGLEYHAIVRWEEELLEERLGDAYRAYARRVPRWLPRGSSRAEDDIDPLMVSLSNHEPFSWRDTLFSERGTLVAIAAGYLLLWLKARM